MREIKQFFVHITKSNWCSPQDIINWHTWPRELLNENKTPNGTFKYMDKIYSCEDELPVDVKKKRGNGWPNPAYTYFIGNPYPTYESWNKRRPDPDHDGKIFEMLPHSVVGYHAKGWNTNSLSVVLVADVDEKGRGILTGSQLRRLRRLTKSIMARYPGCEVMGHYETGDPKKAFCPAIDMNFFRKYLHTKSVRAR